MRLSDFIRQNMDSLVSEWASFADELSTDGVELDRETLRDFAREMLTSVADDIAERQTGRAPPPPAHRPTLTEAARTHAMQRYLRRFSHDELLTEFCAMRVRISSRWSDQLEQPGRSELDQLVHFNEAVDQLVRASLAAYSERREEEQNRNEESLRRRSQRLRELDRQKDQFLATLGHELRNPLAGIDLGIRALKEGTGDRERLQELIEHELQRLTVLTDDLLDASRIARDKIELELSEVDVTELVHASAALFQEQISEKQQNLQLDTGDRRVTLTGDATRLRQIVENLLSNAIRYTPPGGTIQISLGAEDRGAVLTVTDDGQGIPAESLEEIFEPFTQRDTDAGGLGLGLPISRRLAELHGGRLDVESGGVGLGSTFRVHLPAVSATGQPPTRELLERERLPRALRVVVVDDETEFAENLALYLRVRGCQASALDSGTEMLERLEDLAPHVLLVDLGLPHFSGYETAEELQRRAGSDGTLLVAITGYSDDDSAARARAAGFHEQMLKPLDLGRLHEMLLARAARGLK